MSARWPASDEEQRPGDQPPPAGPSGGIAGGWVIAILIVLVVISFANPTFNVPVVSQVVCSVKGGTWYDSSLLTQAGCYKP